MKVLITGITGFIGSALARALLHGGRFEVAGVVRTTSGKHGLDTIRDIADHLSLFYANLSDYHAIKNVIRAFKPNYLIHVGALTAVRNSFEMPHEFNEVNYLGTINLAHACLEVSDFKKFIFASTMEVYGFQKSRRPFPEALPLHPGSPYSVSKAAGEYYLQMAGRAYGLPYLIARASNTYGRTHNTGFVVEYLVTSMLEGKEVYVGTPHARRDLMHVDDHVRAYTALLRYPNSGEVFNFGTEEGVKMLALARLIKKMTGSKSTIIPHFPAGYPYRPVVETYLSVNASKAKKLLRWQPQVSLEAGLKKSISYWREKLGKR